MFNKHIHSKFFVAGAILASLGLASCVDNDYDLDNVDLTIGSDVDLTLPASSTGEILLKSLIDLKEDGVVTMAEYANGDSMYVVSEEGTAHIDPIKIGEIKVTKPEIGKFDSKINVEEILASGSGARKKAPRKITVSGVTIPDKTFGYYLTEEEGKTKINEAFSSKVSEDICELTMIQCNANSLTLELSIDGFPSHVKKLHLDDFKLMLPGELAVSSCTINGKKCASDAPINNCIDKQIWQLTPEIDADGYDITKKLILKVYFNGTSLTTSSSSEPTENIVFNPETHEVLFKGSLSVSGHFRMETSEMDPDQLATLVAGWGQLYDLNTVEGMIESGVVPAKLNFSGVNCFEKDIVVTHVTGSFKHAVGEIDPIVLDDMPDFLNDEDVVLDLENPMLFISTSTDLPAMATTAIKLVSSKNGTEIAERHTAKVEMEGSKVFWFANPDKKTFMPKENKQDKYENPILTPLYDKNEELAGVAGLIRTIPDQIEVEVNEVELTANDIEIGKEYHVNVDYHVYAPVVVGPEFSLVYKDVEKDFKIEDTMDDVMFSDDAVIELTAEVTSTLPTSCTFTVTPLDKDGNVLSILNPVVFENIKPRTANQEIYAKITPKTGHTIQEALHSGNNQIDGIEYKAVLDQPIEGEALTNSGNIVVKNIKIHVKSLVSYDAN